MPGSALNSPFKFLKRFFQGRFNSWVSRRIPPADSMVLHHGIIFILPTRQGGAFMIVLAMMFIGAINYESSLAFALVFLLLSMFLLTIIYTFRNLSGLRLSATVEQAVFAGTPASFVITVERSSKRLHELVGLRYTTSLEGFADLIDTELERVTLQVNSLRRGILHPGRLTVETLFPFGLLRAWSLLDLKTRCLVYPKPVACDLDWLLSAHADSGQLNLQTGNDDFTGLREYSPGDSLRHIAWKNYARGQGLFTKQYSSNVDERIWLNWEMFPDMSTEERLSRLCYCVLELDVRNIDYGIRLPGVEVAPAKGPVHFSKALETLALFRLNDAGYLYEREVM